MPSEQGPEPSGFRVAPGLQLGAYRIEAALGEGGMGIVYRATDSKFNRPVAVKFLADSLSDAAARRRFQREAQLASSLNHPHILTVHDVGEFEGRQYLVTEFVDGGTLKDWARQEHRTWRQIVKLMTGVADAVAVAHEAGILHRDIKPENILISKSGYAKLADFGLARVTEHTEQTRTGSRVIAGTVPYMSPEQAEGATLDARSDIFSFGVVLYELVAGRRPFDGKTDLETLQRLVRDPAPPLAGDHPSALTDVIEKAMEKDRADRYQSMREMVVDLRRLERKSDSDVRAVAPTVDLRLERKPDAAAARRSWAWLPWAAAALIVAGAGAWMLFGRTAAPGNPLEGAQFSRVTNFKPSDVETNPAVSPDGRFVALVSNHDGNFDVWLSQSGSGNLQNLTHGALGDVSGPLRDIGFNAGGDEVWLAGTKPSPNKSGRRLQLLPLVGGTPRNFLEEQAAEVSWSPDGSRLVYHRWDDGDPMFIADGRGVDVRPLLPAGPAGEHRHFPTWSTDGRWIFFVRGQPAMHKTDLWRIPAAGGAPEQLTHVTSDVAFPTPLDADTLLYTAHDTTGAGPWLWLLNVKAQTSRRLSVGFEQYAAIVGTADGRRLVASVVSPQSTLSSVPILLDRPATERDVETVSVPNARALAPRYAGDTLFYLSSRDGADGLWSLRNGQSVEVWKGADGALLSAPAIAPSGHMVAIALRRHDKLVWHVLGTDGTGLRALSANVDAQGAASWSPDGKWIVSGGSDAGGPGLFKIPVDGGAPVRLRSGPALDPVWSPNDDLILYEGANTFTTAPLAGVRPDGSDVNLPAITLSREGERVRFLDGHRLVYMQNTTGAQDFWLLELTTMTSRQLTKFSGTSLMRTFDISPDGRRIVFDRTDEHSEIMLIDRPGAVR